MNFEGKACTPGTQAHPRSLSEWGNLGRNETSELRTQRMTGKHFASKETRPGRRITGQTEGGRHPCFSQGRRSHLKHRRGLGAIDKRSQNCNAGCSS